MHSCCCMQIHEVEIIALNYQQLQGYPACTNSLQQCSQFLPCGPGQAQLCSNSGKVGQINKTQQYTRQDLSVIEGTGSALSMHLMASAGSTVQSHHLVTVKFLFSLSMVSNQLLKSSVVYAMKRTITVREF